MNSASLGMLSAVYLIAALSQSAFATEKSKFILQDLVAVRCINSVLGRPSINRRDAFSRDERKLEEDIYNIISNGDAVSYLHEQSIQRDIDDDINERFPFMLDRLTRRGNLEGLYLLGCLRISREAWVEELANNNGLQ